MTLMSDDPKDWPLLSVGTATQAAAARITRRQHCACLHGKTKKGSPLVPTLHEEAQDKSSQGWNQLKALIEQTRRDRASLFEPSAHLAWEDWLHVVTLPAEIASLVDVTTVRTYGSDLRRLPPEIGRMAKLEELDIYTSYSLHWLPYEVTRCANLRSSRMSTRALYGNRNTRLPFPRLSAPVETLVPATCSVCDRPFEKGPLPLWITLRVGTDIVPLLVHSCSKECTLSLPRPPRGYCDRPHKGGGGVGMPEEGHGPFGMWEGDRAMRLVKNDQTGAEEWRTFVVRVDPETKEVSYAPDDDE